MTRSLFLALGAIVFAGLACRNADVAAQAGQGGVRQPALAGQFYPAEPAQLNAALDGFLNDALAPDAAQAVAIVVPHAGWIYSAQIAADAWRAASTGTYDTVVLLGTNHTSGDLRRVGIYPGSGLRTPLGTVPVDQGLTAALLKDADCIADTAAHEKEHSIEVHLPFVQRLFPKASVVAAIVPGSERDLAVRFGRTLERLLKGRRALIVASSDLSHYPAARDALTVDRRTLEAIATLDVERFKAAADGQMVRGTGNLVTCACGEAPIIAAITAARGLGATRGRVISYANSSELPVGEPDRVVGYGSVVFSTGERGADTRALERPSPSPADSPLPSADRARLLALARETIRRFLDSATLPLGRPVSPGLERVQGAFVTLRKHGELRGCVGQMTATAPLRQLIGSMALAAAFQDSRFDKVRAAELKDIEIEISLLTPYRQVAGAPAILPGRDGVLLKKGGASAVFLPQVATEQGWGRDELLDNLCEKAGIARGCWRSGATLSTFQAEIFKEGESKR